MAGLGSTGPQLVGAQHWQIKNSSVPSWSAKADHPRVLLFMQFAIPKQKQKNVDGRPSPTMTRRK
jgi:hypothetical protein